MTLDALRTKAGFTSYDALADALRKASRGVSYPKSRVLETYLREFNGARRAWWEKRPTAVRALAKLLGASEKTLVALLTEAPEPTEEQTSGFGTPHDSELESLPTLGFGWRLDGAEPSRGFDPLGTDEPEQPVWLVMPPGSGKTLAVRCRNWRHTTTSRTSSLAITVSTLKDLDTALLSSDGHLFLDVENADPAHDPAVIDALGRRKRVFVVAAFPRGTTQGAPTDGSDEAHHGPTDWVDYQWVPTEGWRGLLVDWLTSRSEATFAVDSEQIAARLEASDASEELFATPADVVAWCELLVRENALLESKLRDGNWKWIAKTFIEGRANARSARPTSTDAEAAGVLFEFARCALRDLSEPWPTATTKEEWWSRIPSDLVQAIPDSDYERLIAQMTSASKKAEREAVAERLRKARKPLPSQIFNRIVKLGLLRQRQDGRWMIQPNWLARLLGETVVGEAVNKAFEDDQRRPDLTEWGRWFADATRREFVRNALVRLKDNQLQKLIRLAVTSQSAAPTLAWVGAVEALFCEAGRRFLRGWTPPGANIGTLRSLAAIQLGLLVRRFDAVPPGPVTQPGFHEPEANPFVFLAQCWAWSFAVAAPDDVPAGAEWLFPGWRVPSLLAPESHAVLGARKGEKPKGAFHMGVEGDDPGIDDLLALSPMVITRLPAEELPRKLLAPVGWVLAATRGEWARVRQIELEEPWHLSVAVALLASKPEEVQNRAAEEIFRETLPKHYGNPSLTDLLAGNSSVPDEVIAWVLQRVSVASFEEKCAAVPLFLGRSYLDDMLAKIRPELRMPLAKAIFDNEGNHDVVQSLGADAVEALEMLSGRDDHIMWAAIRRLSEVDADRAMELFHESIERHPDTRVGVVRRGEFLWSLGRTRRSRTLELVRELGSPDWTRQWLVAVVHEGGRDAEEAFTLLFTPSGSRQRG